MIDLLAPLSTKTLMGVVFLCFLVAFALKIVAKVIGTGGVSSEIFLLFLLWPTDLCTRGEVVAKMACLTFFGISSKFLILPFDWLLEVDFKLCFNWGFRAILFLELRRLKEG